LQAGGQAYPFCDIAARFPHHLGVDVILMEGDTVSKTPLRDRLSVLVQQRDPHFAAWRTFTLN
jgi:hypothetical protein